MTSDAQLLHATLCFLADRIGADHRYLGGSGGIFGNRRATAHAGRGGCPLPCGRRAAALL